LANDPELGFITMDDIQNVFSVEMSKMNDDITSNGYPQDPKILMDYIDELRLKLLMRARLNLQEYLHMNPEVKKKAREEKAQEEVKRVTSQGWKDRVSKAREEAIREAYRG
jgi:phage terminase small subunit